jgi:hypothetical protein
MRIFVAAAALALLAACDGGASEERSASNAAGEAVEAPAEGKAEDGRFTMKGPGFDLKINLPDGMTNEGNGENALLYPGGTMSGMHIEAGADGGKAASGVELRFTSTDPVEKVAGWYRDPARKGAFSVASWAREGDALVIAGTQQGDGDPFSLRLVPAGGGTEGRLTLSERR